MSLEKRFHLPGQRLNVAGMETIRTFIAVDLGGEIRSALGGMQERLRASKSRIRWTAPDNMHLTLLFLGDTPTQKIDAIRSAMDAASSNHAVFTVEAKGIGTFGRPPNVRVVWAGIADCPRLEALRKEIVQRISAVNVGFDAKPFSAHVTLGRIKERDDHPSRLLELVARYGTVEFGKHLVDEVLLIQSIPAPAGFRYAVLHRGRLASTEG